ncbi:zinc metallopeptidase [Clostridia bacterium]|nr:zinc metallopeptidase [Clostridia bacterium]
MTFWQISFFLMIPVMIFAGYAQRKISRTYKQYSQVPARRGISGEMVARNLLTDNGITDVSIERTKGNLTDHYDPRNKVLRLSTGVAQGQSIAAIGVAAHEIGHAVQHNQRNFLLAFRNRFAPIAQIGSSMAIPLVLAGYFIGFIGLAKFGVILFGLVVFFQLITVPVEKDASRRALLMLQNGGYLDETELVGAKRVLDAAALTYIASLLVAIAQLFRLMALTRDD